MDPRVANDVSITDLFDQFIEASTMRNVLSIHHRILNYSDLNPCEFNIFFPKLKRAVMTNRARKNWKAKALFSKIDKKAAHRCYSNTKAPTPIGNRPSSNQNSNHNSQERLDDSVLSQSGRVYYNNNALQHYNCLVIGSGPAGLRTAIELQLLGASRVVVVEKRSRFSRNNVLHLWPFVIDDLKSLGAKKFYGKFCAGSIDHISIRQLQLILLKICLMIGCDFIDSCSYLYLCPESIVESKDENESDNKENGSKKDCLEPKNIHCDLDVIEPSTSRNFATTSSSSTDEILAVNRTEASLQDNDRKSPCIGLDIPKRENLRGSKAHFKTDYQFQERELHSHEWDIVIGADGHRNILNKFFPRKEFRGKLAIAITANFINRQTPAEASVSEISGLSFIYNQDMFNALAYDTNIELENICYYKDDTHYFVMTAKKKSLLERGVLIQDYVTTQDLLSSDNVNKQALFKYAKDAAYWTTGLEPLNFALNHYGQEDCAMFDFTSMHAASNSCKAIRTKGGGLTLLSLVGDSLLEPFWPTGSGCARGFLSSFDAAWMCRQWSVNKCAVIDYHAHNNSSGFNRSRASNTSDISKPIEPSTYNRMALSVIAERESIYRILAQTTSENLQQNYSLWTLNPHTRYPNLNRHLITSSQVEHLIMDSNISSDKNKLGLTAERNRRIKSPNNVAKSRKSPKKLKSADCSPQIIRAQLRSSSKFKSKSRHDVIMSDTYLEFEESYKNLADTENGPVQYLNYRVQDRKGSLEDSFIPSISGTFPSSNNLISIEARRARDIDDCLRQRRQKKQLDFVRDRLIGQMRGESVDRNDHSSMMPRGPALFSELRRLREQQSKGLENKPINGPLTLLNSIRRCASFAERVKSFESKLGSSGQESTVSSPKTPIDNVKNLPQFVTLQERFTNRDTEQVKKSKVPVMKLSKDDWNVKCWEKRLAAYKQKSLSKETFGSTKSLNKSKSVDSCHASIVKSKPEKQVEVFKDRIKEMAEKLKITRDQNQKLYGHSEENSNMYPANNRSQGWVTHLRKELIKGTEAKKPQRIMNPVKPSKPIKKLFEDDDDHDDGIDVNKHYDHLCVNKPTNKYLIRNSYTSHLTRTKYDKNSRVIDREAINESERAFITTNPSGSSSSGTLSDYSSTTAGSSLGTDLKQVTFKCFRCDKDVNYIDKITIGQSVLHRGCLTCSNCSITLRTNEIQHYLNRKDRNDAFVCAICEPNIRADLTKEAADRLTVAETSWAPMGKENSIQHRLRSREEFLNEKVNYNELYKGIFIDGNKVSCGEFRRCDPNISPSPIEVTLPLAPKPLIDDLKGNDEEQNYRVALSETINGSEQVTLVLPCGDSPSGRGSSFMYEQRVMIDEDELCKILHLENEKSNVVLDDKTEASKDTKDDDSEESTDEHLDDDDARDLSDDSSSLNSPSGSDDFDDEEDDIEVNNEQNSTFEDFLTSDEFGTASDKADSGDEAPETI